MSDQVKRYLYFEAADSSMQERDNGNWVKYDDYARLERASKRLAERLAIQAGIDERKRNAEYWWKWAFGLDGDKEFSLWLSTDKMAFNRQDDWWYIKDGDQWIKCHKNGNAGGAKGRAKELWERLNQRIGASDE